MSVLLQKLRRYFRQRLWFRPAMASLFSVAMAAGALFFGREVEGRFDLDISEESLVSLFGIFASSMLSVATFTVSAIVTAASSASNSTTPRASRFVLSDKTAQTVLSAFIAAFIYSICGILALKAFHYGHAGRFILFVGLIAIVIFVLLSFINWVDHVMKLGRQSTTIQKMHDAAMESMNAEGAGTFGAKPWDGRRSDDFVPVYSSQFGYVVDLGMEGLQDAATKQDCNIYLAVRPGEYVEVTTPIAYVAPKPEALEALAGAIRSCVTLAPSREADHDIRFNIVNLAETADRALSPAVNDPGTAINILNVLLEVIAKWADLQRRDDTVQVRYERLHVQPITPREILNDAFTPIARDGAGVVEIGIRLQKVLAAISRLGHPELAVQAGALSKTALDLSDTALVSEEHRRLVRAASGVQMV